MLVAGVVLVGALEIPGVHVELPALLVRTAAEIHLHDDTGGAFSLAGDVGEVLILGLIPVVDGVLDVVEAVREDGPAVLSLVVRSVLAFPHLEDEVVVQVVVAQPVAELLGLLDFIELVTQVVAGSRNRDTRADALQLAQFDLGDLPAGIGRVDHERSTILRPMTSGVPVRLICVVSTRPFRSSSEK